MSIALQVEVIPRSKRGVTQNEWLESYHTYSFGKYQNLSRLNFGPLRVFNEDFVEPGRGFTTHAHDNMEIITIVLSGSLEHRDSSGNRGILKPGDIQRMSAGSGIEHSEVNPSKTEKVHFLQIWIYPDKRDLAPSYEQKSFGSGDLKNRLHPVVTPIGGGESLSIRQDASLFLGHFGKGKTWHHEASASRRSFYLFVIEGSLKLGDHQLTAGDSAQITGASAVALKALERAKLLLIELDAYTTLS